MLQERKSTGFAAFPCSVTLVRMAMHTGACHCGNVQIRFESAEDPAQIPLRACACSFCRSHGARTLMDANGSVEFSVQDESLLSRYRWSLKTADFLVCARCGNYCGAVIAHGGQERAIVNANLLHDRMSFDRSASSVSYEGETEEGRIARRMKNWTPAKLSVSDLLFDALSGEAHPCAHFGPIISRNADVVSAHCDRIIGQVRGSFGVEITPDAAGAMGIERIIDGMWREDWDRGRPSLDLFTHDLGVLLFHAMHVSLGGEPAFRSTLDLTHVSLHWADQQLEIFPVHRIIKRLRNPKGESVAYFFNAIASRVTGA
jgi:hypothetical protein